MPAPSCDRASPKAGNVLARTVTHALVGLDPRRVEVEAHLQRGVPAFAIVGLADRACQEAKERVRSGIASAELEWPLRRITVNLAPADLRKEGSGFDLPIALAVLAASRQLPPGCLVDHAAVGELALDGRLRPCRARSPQLRARVGAAPAASSAPPSRERRWRSPASNRCPCVTLPRLSRTSEASAIRRRCPSSRLSNRPTPCPDLSDVRGQERARRALEIAAAGSHNLLLAGPPGIGKSMLARRLPGILPVLDDASALEVTRIHSVAGLLPPGTGLVRTPPFRAPHHTASAAAVVGGGSTPRPGEATLAHHGVLLLDELPEFPRPVLEALRQPLEDGTVAVARVGGRVVFPARFQLVGTMNLCPCGARGDAAVECTCSPQRIDRYRERLSRALLDRFDLVVALPRPRGAELAAPPGEPSAVVRERVTAARPRGEARPLDLDPAAGELLTRAVERLPLSGRGRARVARVARTIAVLAGAQDVGPEHVAEALSYRSPLEFGHHVNELALVVFAATRDAHAVDRDARTSRFAAFAASFDEEAYRADLERRGLRWVARTDALFPTRLASVHDPPPGLFLRGNGARRASLASGRGGRRCEELQRLRRSRRTDPRARSCSGGDRRGVGPGERRRRLGAPGRPGRRRAVRGGARLWDRPRLPASALIARRPASRHRARRLRIPTRCGASAVAVSRSQPHRCGPRRGHRCGRGTRAKRGADHRRPRTRRGP